MKMLQLRTALFSDSDKFDPEAFAWTGRARAPKEAERQDRPSDHLVNVLAAQMGRDGHFNVEALMATYVAWTTPPAEKPAAEAEPAVSA
jgi:hypothetical protein